LKNCRSPQRFPSYVDEDHQLRDRGHQST
jgi:hypothetical protein